MSGPEEKVPEPEFLVIDQAVRPALDMSMPEGLAAWRQMNLPRRGWRVVGYESAEPGQWIARPCAWCAETIESAAFTIMHPKASRPLETCRLCRLTLEGRETTPGIKVIATPDARGRSLETELQRRHGRARRSIDRVELTRGRNWFLISELRYRYIDPKCPDASITTWYDVTAGGWLWEAIFPDSTHRDGGPVVSCEDASKQFLQAKLDWQNA